MKFLLTSDWHLRSTVPSCLDNTVEEWIQIQKDALYKIKDIAIENDVKTILMCGDLFHSEQTASNEIIHIAQEFVKDCYKDGIEIYFLCGNHDLICHSSENLYRSAMGVFLNSEYVNIIKKDSSKPFFGGNFDEDVTQEDCSDYRVLCKHILCIPKNDIPKDIMNCETPESLLEKYKINYIFLGDYHRNFEYHLNHSHVFNPGCLTKQASDFEEYITGVYIVDIDNEISKFCPVNIEQKFNHNGQEKKELDQSIENFVQGIKKENITLDYVTSLKNEAKNHPKDIQDKIETWIEKSGN